MRWLSSFALLLYLSLLCTPQAFAVHDARLSPLADTQFHAVTPQMLHADEADRSIDSADEPVPVLLSSYAYAFDRGSNVALAHCSLVTSQLLSFSRQARAPPVLTSQYI